MKSGTQAGTERSLAGAGQGTSHPGFASSLLLGNCIPSQLHPNVEEEYFSGREFSRASHKLKKYQKPPNPEGSSWLAEDTLGRASTRAGLAPGAFTCTGPKPPHTQLHVCTDSGTGGPKYSISVRVVSTCSHLGDQLSVFLILCPLGGESHVQGPFMWFMNGSRTGNQCLWARQKGLNKF